MSRLTYRETLDRLYALDARKGMDFRLERLSPVLSRLGHPQKSFASIHVAGTNGKGSTAAMLHAVYREAGYRTGLYTSPHLVSFRERIRIGTDFIEEADVVRFVARVEHAAEEAGEELTFFEITTLAAFAAFAEARVEIAVVEAGLGGRLDATNVVVPAAAVIVSVDLDHAEFLGGTLESVAREKAGIAKAGVPLVTGPLPPAAAAVVRAAAGGASARWLDAQALVDAEEVPEPGLLGAHQRANARVATAVVRVLAERFPVAPGALRRGLRDVRWPARYERFDGPGGLTIVDGAHNPAAAAALLGTLRAEAPSRPRVLVFGALSDKDWPAMLETLVPAFDLVHLVPVDYRRSFAPRDALGAVAGVPAEVFASAGAGLAAARTAAGRAGTVVVTGSIFLAGELYGACAGEGTVDAALSGG